MNNAHFLTALNFARYCEHRGIKCPVVFVISDNNKCISLKGYKWTEQFVKGFIHKNEKPGSYDVADGSDILDIHSKSKKLIDYTRRFSRPSLLVVNNLPRRFGHAATDRQFAYMSKAEIDAEMARDPLAMACAAAIDWGIFQEADFETFVKDVSRIVEESFDQAVLEPKITSREALISSNSRPLAMGAGIMDRVILGLPAAEEGFICLPKAVCTSISISIYVSKNVDVIEKERLVKRR